MKSELEVIQSVQAHEAGAVQDLFTVLYPRMYRLCARLLESRGLEAEQVARLAFSTGLLAIRDPDFKGSAFIHMRRHCVKECFVRLRSRVQVLLDLLKDLDAFLLSTAAEDFLGGVGAAQMTREKLLWRDLLHSLPDTSMKLLEDRSLQDLQYSSTSVTSGIPMGLILARLVRSSDQMKMTLEDISNRYRCLDAKLMDLPDFNVAMLDKKTAPRSNWPRT